MSCVSPLVRWMAAVLLHTRRRTRSRERAMHGKRADRNNLEEGQGRGPRKERSNHNTRLIQCDNASKTGTAVTAVAKRETDRDTCLVGEKPARNPPALQAGVGSRQACNRPAALAQYLVLLVFRYLYIFSSEMVCNLL